ncbi:MAG: hypothetical protein J6B18_02400 [Bacteroidaceae bacterium]|nr:hypothetical protein [Bacteroidaceae bacterium]
MKNTYSIICLALLLLLAACGGDSQKNSDNAAQEQAPVAVAPKGKKFAPKKRVSSLTAEEREAAIKNKIA